FHVRALAWAARPATAAEPQSSGNSDRRLRSGRQRDRVDLDHAVAQAHPVRRELLGERRRRAAVREAILVTVPRAGDEPVDDAAFAERAILVCAEVRERPDLVAIAEH